MKNSILGNNIQIGGFPWKEDMPKCLRGGAKRKKIISSLLDSRNFHFLCQEAVILSTDNRNKGQVTGWKKLKIFLHGPMLLIIPKNYRTRTSRVNILGKMDVTRIRVKGNFPKICCVYLGPNPPIEVSLYATWNHKYFYNFTSLLFPSS